MKGRMNMIIESTESEKKIQNKEKIQIKESSKVEVPLRPSTVPAGSKKKRDQNIENGKETDKYVFSDEPYDVKI